MKSTVSNVLVIAGLVAVPCGLWMLAPWLGVVALGPVLVALGFLLDPPGGSS